MMAISDCAAATDVAAKKSAHDNAADRTAVSHLRDRSKSPNMLSLLNDPARRVRVLNSGRAATTNEQLSGWEKRRFGGTCGRAATSPGRFVDVDSPPAPPYEPAKIPDNPARAPWIEAMKVRNSLKSLRGRHRDNRIVRRKGRVYVINKTQK